MRRSNINIWSRQFCKRANHVLFFWLLEAARRVGSTVDALFTQQILLVGLIERLNYNFYAKNPFKLQVKHKNFESFKINCDSYSYIYLFEL